MQYIRIFDKKRTVSKIGFGTWAIGGNSYGPVHDKDSINALEYAFDQGINFYDTADLYGNGHSESLLGKVFSKKRDQVIIASKVGYSLVEDNQQNFCLDYIENSLYKSLKRLKTDYLDIYMLHSPPLDIIRSEKVYHLLERFKKKGVIRNIGISLRLTEDAHVALSHYAWDFLQLIYNLVDQRPARQGIFKQAYAKKSAIIARLPLCSGFLTGKYHSNNIDFKENDHRRRWSREQIEKWTTTAAKYDFLSQKYHKTLTQIALKFCISSPYPVIAIPGMKTVNQVRENIEAVSIPDFTADELHEIETIYHANPTIPVIKK